MQVASEILIFLVHLADARYFFGAGL